MGRRTMMLTTHDVLSVLQGGALMCGFDDDTEGLLRKAGTPIDPESLAEKRALDDGLPIVQVTHDEAVRLAHGDIMLVSSGAGAYVVRLMTPEEMLDAHRRACKRLGGEPTLTLEQATQLVAHL